MLEIYNYILGIFIAVLFSLNHGHLSKVVIIRKFAVMVFLYVGLMSLVRSSFPFNLFLKLLYFTVCFMMIRHVNFFQAYYDSLIIVLLYLLSYVFCVYVMGNAGSYQIDYFQLFDYFAVFAGLLGFYCLSDLQLLNTHIHGDLHDLVFMMLISLILSVFGCILLFNSLIGKWNIYFFIIFIGFFIVSVGIVILFNYCFILKRNEEIRKSAYQMQQLDQVYYQDLEKSNLELKKIRHDHKNHLINLKQLISCKKNEDAIEYIDKMIKSTSVKK